MDIESIAADPTYFVYYTGSGSPFYIGLMDRSSTHLSTDKLIPFGFDRSL